MGDRNGMLYAGSFEDLKAAGHKVVHGPDRPIVVFYNGGDLVAVENRCPHMGFPLHRGSCVDGVITCPWHHARFDAASGGAFDAFAGDADPFDVELDKGEVYVSAMPRKTDFVARARRRLREGLDTNNPLTIAKSILILRQHGAQSDILRETALFGVANRDDWSAGMAVLAMVANLMGHLSDQTSYLALYQAARRVAGDCAGQAARRERLPLDNDSLTTDQMRSLMDEWTRVRHRDGAERTLLTAIRNRPDKHDEIAALLGGAASGRMYSDSGHVVDFTNKALELTDEIGWEHAASVLPTTLSRMMSGRGGEEDTAWMAPDDLVSIAQDLSATLPGLVAQNDGAAFEGTVHVLAQEVLAHDAAAIAASLRSAADAGASAAQIGQAVAYAAAVRVAQFHTSNEFGDWFTVLHSFTYCHAAHALIRRAGDPRLVRAAVHGAYTVFLNRFLNVPAMKAPEEWADVSSRQGLIDALLDSFEGRSEADAAGRITATYYDMGYPVDGLIDTLGYAVLMEDFDFHTLQMLEGAVKELDYWPGAGEQRRTLLVAAARYIAAFAPTRRTQLQTARIAQRLHRGEAMFDEAEL